MDYATYLRLDELLGVQQPRSRPEHPDELAFVVVHQVSELWFKLMLHELGGFSASTGSADAPRALGHLNRTNSIIRALIASITVLETLTPNSFAAFRSQLGSGSGSQSVQFHRIEGLRLETALLSMLQDTGVTLADIYRDPSHMILRIVADQAIEYDANLSRWRFRHLQLVERIIGIEAPGTGGTAGAKHLRQTVHRRSFPALWSVRSELAGT